MKRRSESHKHIRIPDEANYGTGEYGTWVHEVHKRGAAGCDLNAGRGSTPQFIVSLEYSYAHAVSTAAYIVTDVATTRILTDNIYIRPSYRI